MSAWVFLIPPALLIGWFVLTYNALVRLRQQVDESWSGIDTELRRRYDLIPNLVDVVKGYAAHESRVLENVVVARDRAAAFGGTPGEQAAQERELTAGVDRLLAVAEAYPDLKASAHFLQLQHELADTEDRIQAARRFFNANVRDLNTRVEVFPSNLVAASAGFKAVEFFEVEKASVRRAVDVSFVD